MSDAVKFQVGEQEFELPALTWRQIEDIVMPHLDESRQEGRWYVARGHDVRIVHSILHERKQTELTLDGFRDALSYPQAQELSRQLVELLRVSGFEVTQPGESTAASDSTETSESSSQT